jgi:hypothetical protein
MLKSKIKESFTKGNYPKAPWIALPQYIAKYKLAKELPADIAEAEEKHLKKVGETTGFFVFVEANDPSNSIS